MLLQDLARRHHADKVQASVSHYLPLYAGYFEPVRFAVKRVLEIGVNRGGSVKMWQEYFPNAEIIGVDCKPACAAIAGERIKIFIGSQDDPEFLAQMAREVGNFDIIIDDGGHQMKQQKTSLQTLFTFLCPGGTYVIEDLCTSYRRKWGGGLKNRGSTVNFLKTLVDSVNNRCYKLKSGCPTAVQAGELASTEDLTIWDQLLAGIHFYPGICFLFRRLGELRPDAIG